MRFVLSLLLCGLLSAPMALYGQGDELERIRQYVLDHVDRYGLSEEDISDWTLSHQHVSNVSGAHYIYLQQNVGSVPIDNALLTACFDKAGFLRVVNSRFVHDLANAKKNAKVLTDVQALELALRDVGLVGELTIEDREYIGGAVQKVLYSMPEHAYGDVVVSLVYLSMPKHQLRLHWQVRIATLDGLHHWIVFVDTETGAIGRKRDLTVHCDFGPYCSAGQKVENPEEEPVPKEYADGLGVNTDSYRVYADPLESPNHGDSTLETNPADAVASPYGWHDTNGVPGAEYTITRGNNVYAQEDRDNNNNTFGNAPDGGAGLDFDFSADFSADPTTNPTQNAAITNLFYWNNLMHDVWYHHGFDEAAGNFQENNYGNGGLGGDYVIADAQDGGGQNNANFSTPEDGSNPRMQMYLWDPNNPSDPDLDSDFDNGIIVHEYAHGISNRLSGGAAAAGCLHNAEQPGEGWSDWFALVMTHEAGDTRTTPRGIGTYVLEQDPNTGTGIRQYPYTTDMTVNPHTYDDIIGNGVHGTGSVWCAMLWELYWDLVDQDGYDSDLINGTGGNNKAMDLVMEGMKLQPCSPGFVDARDAILQADELLYGGANKCLIWNAFARRGLGVSAIQGSSSSRDDGVEAFDVKGAEISKTSDLTEVDVGQVVSYTIQSASNCVDYTGYFITDTLPAEMSYVPGSASDGGVYSNGVITWPVISNFTSGMTTNYSYQATLNPGVYQGNTVVFSDDMEAGTGDWTVSNTTGLSNWTQVQSPDCGSMAWYAEELEANPNTENQYLDLAERLLDGIVTLSFDHWYDTEINWDGGQVEISIDGGNNWIDLGPQFTQNGYNDYIKDSPSEEAFSGQSGGCIRSVVDLTPYCGERAIIRFNFYYDQFVSGNGWYIDNVELSSTAAVRNVARADLGGGQEVRATHCVKIASAALPVDYLQFETGAGRGHIQLDWKTVNEYNNKGFFVERSRDGVEFEILAWVDADKSQGDSYKEYQYRDYEVLPGLWYYYRLKQLDQDGRFSYSIVRRAMIEDGQKPWIRPNPIERGQSLVIDLPTSGSALLCIKNISGQVVRCEPMVGKSHRLDLHSIVPGVYILSIRTGGEQIIRKLVVQ